MTTEAVVLRGEDPYEGLRELSAKVWALVLKRLERVQAWRKMRPIAGGAPGLWDDIRNFLWSLLSYLRPWDLFQWLKIRVFDPLQHFLRHHILNPFLNWISRMQDRLTGWWAGAINSVKSHLTWLHNRLTGWWHGAINWILGHLTRLKNTTLNWWAGAISGVKSHLTWLHNRLTGWWHGAIKWILGHFTWLKDRILGFWRGAIDRIYAVIERLRAFLHDPLEGLRKILKRFQESWAGQLLSSLIQGMSSLWNTIIATLREVWRRIHPTIVEAAETAMTFARPHIKRWVGAFQELPAKYLNYVVATAGSNLALQPSRALATAGSLYALSIAAGSAAMLTSTALNLIPATNWVGASQFAAFISEAAGFEPLTRATYGVLLNQCLRWPLQYHWNMQLRPKLPTEGTIFLMGRKRGIDRAEFYQAMGYQGIPNWWLDKIYLFFWTDPSPFWLARIAESTIPDWRPGYEWQRWADQWIPGWRGDPFRWFRAKLMLAGYENADVDSMIQGIQGKLMASAVTQVKTSVRAMLRDAYWTKADAERNLRPLNVRQEEIELLYIAEELDYQKGYLDDQVRYYKEAFRKGEIDLQDLNMALTTIIVKPQRVAQEVSRERVRALPKPKPIVEPKEDPRVRSLRTQAVNSWTKAYRAWDIGPRDLLLGLTIVIQDRELAKKLVAVEKTRLRPPPPPPPPPPEPAIVVSLRRQAVNSWIKRYRAWEIDERELLNGLTIVLQDPALARELVEVEKKAVRPPPPVPPPPPEPIETARSRRAAIASWVDRFRREEISARALEVGLGPLIDDPAIIDEMVRLERLRAEIPPPPAVPPPEPPEVGQARRQAIASWVTAFRNGEIDKDELELYLEPLIPVSEIRYQVVGLEQLRYVPTPDLIPPVSEEPELAKVRTEAVRGHIEMFQKRLIVIEQLYAYLLADGLVEPVARDTVITQATRRIRIPRIDSPYFLKDVIRDLIDQGLMAYEQMFMDRTITIDQYVAWLTSITADPDVVTYLADTLTLRHFLEGL